MAVILPNFGSGGANLTPGGVNQPSLAVALRDIADDLNALRTAFNTAMTKLNNDAGVTDTNYAAVGVMLTQKG